MRDLFLVVFVLLFFGSCSKELNGSNIDFDVANRSLLMLLAKCDESDIYRSRELQFEEPIGKKYTYCNSSGAYIKFGGFFVTEYGLFMPSKGSSVDESNGRDPSYKNISGSVYSYRIEG